MKKISLLLGMLFCLSALAEDSIPLSEDPNLRRAIGDPAETAASVPGNLHNTSDSGLVAVRKRAREIERKLMEEESGLKANDPSAKNFAEVGLVLNYKHTFYGGLSPHSYIQLLQMSGPSPLFMDAPTDRAGNSGKGKGTR